MSGKWPHKGDSPVTIARKVALTYRTHLHTANPVVCGRIDDAMRAYGQLWIVSSIITTDAEDLIGTADAAELAGVTMEAIRKWRSRGYIDRDGQRRYLQVRDRDAQNWPLFEAGEVLAIAATIRARPRAA